jgi:N-methylhydantoinase A/oxoprolinase/acetone carboxylase beta subunit
MGREFHFSIDRGGTFTDVFSVAEVGSICEVLGRPEVQ